MYAMKTGVKAGSWTIYAVYNIPRPAASRFVAILCLCVDPLFQLQVQASPPGAELSLCSAVLGSSPAESEHDCR
jgi:hypothetical protein